MKTIIPWVYGFVAVMMANQQFGDNIDGTIGDDGRNNAVGKSINQNDNRTYNYGDYRNQDELSPLDRIRQMEQHLYGNKQSGEPGLIQRVRNLNRLVQINTAVEVVICILLIWLIILK